MNNWTIDSPQTLDIDNVRNLRLLAISGRFDVIAHQDPAETVTRLTISEITGDPLEIVNTAERLDIKHGKTDAMVWLTKDNPLSSRNHLVITVEVPAQTVIDAKTVSGEGLVTGLNSTVKVSSVSGSIVSDATKGALSVNTISGEAIVKDHQGALSTNSVSGEITASGWLESIKASTVTGDLNFDVLGPIRTVSTNSVSGSVLLRLPEELSCQVLANSLSGSINVNEESIKVIGSTTRQFGDPKQPMVKISVNSVSGSITVFNRLSRHEQEGVQ
ncbi:DUF4097 family beta strand repeat-containing protein [Psychromicrobium sp. YIM B11713]|uniref:DUF4097 family beta strand repeat-containing protein n=1 Tax=Psychromicrobium sp. YIM B11713 TaxID=3145233 RepID=UPI00374FDB6C